MNNFKISFVGLALAGCLFLALAMSFSSFTTAACSCSNAPANVVKTSQSVSSVAFAWDAAGSATAYEVWYVRQGDGYTSMPITVTNTAANFTGLQAGQYVFYFRAVCGNEKSDIIIFEDILMG